MVSQQSLKKKKKKRKTLGADQTWPKDQLRRFCCDWYLNLYYQMQLMRYVLYRVLMVNSEDF